MTPRFALLLAARTGFWLWCLGAFFFAFGFLGRYRVAAMVFLFFGLIWLSPDEAWNLERVAPFSLLDDRFAFERVVWPGRALAIAAGWAVGFSALGFLLGSVRDATVAGLLAEQMSSREKIVITMFALATMVAVGVKAEEHDHRVPVHLPGGVTHARDGRVSVQVASTQRVLSPEQEATLRRAGGRLADRLAAFSRQLGGVPLPPVFVVHRADLKADEFQNGNLDYAQGALVRADLGDPAMDAGKLEGFVLRHVLLAKSRGRAEMESLAWVTDGVTAWWPVQGELAGEGSLSPELRDRARRAVAQAGLSAATFREWLRVRKLAEEDDAVALGAVALYALAQHRGAEGGWKFLRACFAADVPKDVRGWWREVTDPPERRLRRTAEADFAVLAEWVREELDAP